MSDEKNAQQFRESYHPKNSEFLKVHTVQQKLDTQNLKVPLNRASTVVFPSKPVEHVPASIKSHN